MYVIVLAGFLLVLYMYKDQWVDVLSLLFLFLFSGFILGQLFKYFKKDYIPWAFWVVLPAAIIGGALSLYFWQDKEEIAALIFTSAFIAWYSIEASKLVKTTKEANLLSRRAKQEMSLANKITILPAVIAEYAPHWAIKLRNVGNGPALNITVNSDDTNYSFKTDKNVLASGEEISLEMKKQVGGNWIQMRTEDWVELGTSPLTITISFDRIKKLHNALTTKVIFRNPPSCEINEMKWGI